ncbi:MAG: hypothetical protein HN348_04470 [Proteobacteria bacterium]|jgi:hypothetical protein|nr:hypothetical protein [Pseudomonadota bacterium]
MSVCALMLTALLLISPTQAKPITVPVDVGIGAGAHLITGPMFKDQPIYGGLVLSLQAILDKELLRESKDKIPKQYRDQVMSMGEIRISPSIFIPDTLFISPAVQNTGMYGISWRPLALGIPLLAKPVRLDVNAGLRLTYAFIHSTTIDSPTHFIRPGIDLRAGMEIPITAKVLTSIGWNSQFYPPQPLGGKVLAFGPFSNSIWHMGQAYWKFHFRFPYKVNL